MKTIRTFSLLTLLVMTAAVGHASPAVITSGTASMTNQGGPTGTSMNFAGDGFSVLAGGHAFGVLPCTICMPGEMISLTSQSGTWGFSDLSGSVTMAGTQYFFINQSTSDLPYVSGTGGISFTGGSVQVPIGNDPFVTLAAPFSIRGGLAGAGVFSLDFVGEGTATLVLQWVNNRYQQFGNVTYDFTTPTPEPLTMVLMASALMGLAAKLRKRT